MCAFLKLLRAGYLFSALVTFMCTVVQPAYAQPDGKHCLSQDPLTSLSPEFELRRQYVLSSLKKLYHGGYRTQQGVENILCMSLDQYQRAQQRYQHLSQSERDLLDTRYCEYERDSSVSAIEPACENDLIYWALRDSDDDGILDFRVKEYGSLIQNDPDADNDGIENLMDAFPLEAPFTSSTPNLDSDEDGLPDHLDWSNTDRHASYSQKTERLVEIQREIFNDFGIVLIEAEGSEISERFADMTLDVLQVFRNMYEAQNARQFTRSITLAKQYDYDPFGVLAEVSPVNGQILVFEYGIENLVEEKRNLVAPFMVYIHEFAHVIQNAMDFPGNMDGLLRFNAHNNTPNFIEAVRRMDWTIPIEDQVELDLTGGFVDHGNEPVAFTEMFRETSLSELQSVCLDDVEQRFNFWAQYNIVTCYSLDGVREWHAEYITATVLRQMFRHLDRAYPQHSAAIIDLAQKTMSDEWGGENYDYQNVDNRISAMIEADLLIEHQVLENIVSRYLVEPYLHDTELTLAEISEVELLTDR